MKFLLLLLCAAQVFAQEKKVEKLAPYLPTPLTIVEKMLQLANLKPKEQMWDLGSGDGRIVIMAAQKFGADATGVEFDFDLFHQSAAKIRDLGLNARIILGDIFDQDYSKADVLTIYLLPESNEKLRPLLEKQVKKGARIVCHDFPIAKWTPTKIDTIDDDGEGRSHTLYLYVR
jgi:16S rRNA A1518/A1519 N6-dimethyltransferase RsmA/KsgA/DIM1 with predicted DNA glycosylase/AP lyase activity